MKIDLKSGKFWGLLLMIGFFVAQAIVVVSVIFGWIQLK
jgi:cbb3-type cytochrome oxidase subunit 3